MYVIVKALGYFVQFLEFMIFIRIIMSWVRINPYSSFYSFVFRVTEPILGPFREGMNRLINTGPIDFSPIVALLAIRLIYNMLVGILFRIGF